MLSHYLLFLILSVDFVLDPLQSFFLFCFSILFLFDFSLDGPVVWNKSLLSSIGHFLFIKDVKVFLLLSLFSLLGCFQSLLLCLNGSQLLLFFQFTINSVLILNHNIKLQHFLFYCFVLSHIPCVDGDTLRVLSYLIDCSLNRMKSSLCVVYVLELILGCWCLRKIILELILPLLERLYLLVKPLV